MIIKPNSEDRINNFIRRQLKLLGKQKQDRGSAFEARQIAEIRAQLRRTAEMIYTEGMLTKVPEGYREIIPDEEYMKRRPELKGCRFFTCAIQ